ncbi:MAG: ribosomal-protein-alanine N-acetyltransferase [Ruminococcus sp.]|nr:ribosomal-protein-alanine N-acetyltransferase [Ruminococcus sp.]
MMQRADIYIRNACPDEAVLLHAYDSVIFHEGWSEKSFLSSIQSINEIVPVAVSEETGEIIAYAAVSFVLDEANINRIAVVDKYRGNGIGIYMLEYIEKNLPDIVSVYNLEVRESNTHAIDMYKRAGYDVLGMRRNFYRNPEENALLMTKRKV